MPAMSGRGTAPERQAIILRMGLIGAMVVFALGSAQGHPRQGAPATAPSFIAYDDFMKAKCWLEWVAEDLVDYVATVRR